MGAASFAAQEEKEWKDFQEIWYPCLLCSKTEKTGKEKTFSQN